jgi:hypothetical protein
MANYAVIDNGTVINVVVADSLEVAQEATDRTCIESTDENPITIGWFWDEGANAYIQPSPYPSWTYNTETRSWKAPTPKPAQEGKDHYWDETSRSWIEIVTE